MKPRAFSPQLVGQHLRDDPVEMAILKRAYDTRVREIIARTGDADLFPDLDIPRGTRATWVRRGPRDIVGLDEELDAQATPPRGPLGLAASAIDFAVGALWQIRGPYPRFEEFEDAISHAWHQHPRQRF